MRKLVRVILICQNGVDEIRLCYENNGSMDNQLGWPDGKKGIFLGISRNGFYKYKEVE